MDERGVQGGIAAVDDRLRHDVALFHDHVLEHMSDGVQRPLDISADTRFVPRSELLDKRIDAQVENGLQCVFLGGEVVVKQRSCASRARCDGRDRQTAQPIFDHGLAYGREDFVTTVVVRQTFVMSVRIGSHGAPLRQSRSFTDYSLDLC